MNIGETLKKYRLSKNKTQQEWIGDIISPSFYSKVENKEHRISAEDFFLIINKNNININEFLSHMEINKTLFENYNDKIIDAYFTSNIPMLKYLTTEISNEKFIHNDEKILLQSLVKCILLYLTGDENIMDSKTINYLKNKFFSLENWNIFKLTLYINIMSIYDFQSNNEIISSILKKELNLYNEEQLDSILIVLINHISTCISINQDNLAEYYLSYIDDMKPTVSNYFQKNVALYYSYLIEYRKNQTREYKNEIIKIIQGFERIGFDDFSRRLKIYFLENSKVV